jgi:hypothetical protein
VLIAVNRPFARISPNLRQTLGWIGLTNAFLAVGLLIYAMFFKS